MGIVLFILSYIYNPADWQHYPKLTQIQNFTADSFSAVYAVTPEAIVELEEQSYLPRRFFSSAQGLPADIDLAAFDQELGRFWVVSRGGELYTFSPSGGRARRIFIPSENGVDRLGFWGDYLFLDRSSSVIALNRHSERTEQVKPDSATNWVDPDAPEVQPTNLQLLQPWFMIDEELGRRYYSSAYRFRHKIYVAVSGYGYLVFNGLSWRELLRYRSPRAENVNSLFAADSSIYAFGSNGVDQLIPEGRVIHHSFNFWGTTSDEQPAWSWGITHKLKRTSYDKVRLIDGNLFLIESREADVFNIATKTLTEISGNAWIYDLDYHGDSVFVATDEGVFLNLIREDTIIALKDERAKLYRDDVLGIVRGDNARYFWTGRMVVKQASNGQASNGQASNGQASDGQASDGQASDGQTSNGQTSNGQTSNGQTSNGQTSNGQGSYGWDYFTAPGFMPVPQNAVAGRDSLVVLGGKGGVVIYNPETYFQLSLTTGEGLLSDNVTALLVDGDYLWIASDAGLQRFDLSAVLY